MLRPLYILAALVGLGLHGPASAQPASQLQAAFEGVGLAEQLGHTIPLDLTFRDEAGQPVALRQYFGGGRPVLLTMVYHNCPMLCNMILDGLTTSLRELEWTPGQQFDIVTVSFAPDETPELAARQKAKYVQQLGRPEAAAGWHFLTGEEADIQALARAVGFEFRWDERQQQYAHPATIMFLSPDGIVTRYLYGFEYTPRSVRTALVEAGEGRVGNTLDRLILYCFQYDPNKGSYVPHALNIMKLGGLLTMLLLGTLLVFYWRRERQALDEWTVSP